MDIQNINNNSDEFILIDYIVRHNIGIFNRNIIKMKKIKFYYNQKKITNYFILLGENQGMNDIDKYSLESDIFNIYTYVDKNLFEKCQSVDIEILLDKTSGILKRIDKELP